jgi:hypothetical protein
MNEESNDHKLNAAKQIYDVNNWLNIHVHHLGYLRNLIILLSTAEIGFVLSDSVQNIELSCSVRCAVNVALILSLISIGSGLLLAMLEEWNFRLKRKISRIIVCSTNYEEARNKYSPIETTCTNIESANRIVFFIQMFLFFIATILLSRVLF